MPKRTTGTKTVPALRTLPRNPGLRFWTLVRLSLRSSEYAMLVMLAVYTILDIVFYRSVPSSLAVLQTNLVIGAAIIGLAVWYRQTGSRAAHILHSFYVGPVIYIGYSQIHNYIMLVNPTVWDFTLAGWDRAIFGVDPTVWLMHVSHPVLTEYFQLCYNTFYFMLAVPAVVFFVNKQMRQFRMYLSMMVLCFVVSFLLYLLMPAIGPRFSVHDYHSIDAELPGLLLTKSLRLIIDAGNGINAVALKDPYHTINHDCMPSGHTMMSVVAMLMAFRLGSRWKWFNLVGGVSVIISTVYLRYHYGVDVLAGAALGVIMVLLYPYIIKAWKALGVRI